MSASSLLRRLRGAPGSPILAPGLLRVPAPGLLPVVGLLLLATGCGRESARVTAERAVLERERTALLGYLAESQSGPLLPPADLRITVRDRLVQTLLDAGLPQERILADRYRVVLREARVRFRSSLALVELRGRASLSDEPGVFADISVFGLLEVVGLDPERSTLRARVEVVALEATDVGVGGLSPPAERLVERLAESRIEELNRLLEDLEIPVRLQEVVELPGVETAEVTVPPAAPVALGVALREVRVLRDRLWIAVGVEVAGPSGPRRAPEEPAAEGADDEAPAAGDGETEP